MGYDLTIKGYRRAGGDKTLHLSVWEMSTIRDRMFSCGAVFWADPPTNGVDLARRHPGNNKGIPAYKLAMIDGFLVRPDEIKGALEAISRGLLPPIEGPLWKTWLGFLELASTCGGFTVE